MPDMVREALSPMPAWEKGSLLSRHEGRRAGCVSLAVFKKGSKTFSGKEHGARPLVFRFCLYYF